MIRLHLIPLLPFLGAAFCLLGARAWKRGTVHVVACGSVLAAALVTATAWLELSRGAPLLRDVWYTWIASGDLRVNAAFVFDRLSGTMCAVVTGVGFLIHVYSTGYMHDDPSYARYFGYLNLFTGSMLVLVLADSLPLLFVGWEGVGVCSYLLIGFWYEKTENADAGKKAFLTNRIGDLGFLLGMLVLWTAAGALDYRTMQAAAPRLDQPLWLGHSAAAWAALLLFVGATGKSAQLPLYVWLPDAMAGPTPVSALIHAATMVTAGVYMVARMGWLYAMAPVVLDVVAWTGAATALYAATIGFAQTDIKRVLAYSTISQIGFMFVGVAAGLADAGSADPGIFHLVTHAFFKACLFLGAGSIIHAMGGRQEMGEMGGLRKPLPWTHGTFLVATLAIAGVPPLSGFFSKDAILEAALARHAWLFALLVAAAACTAFYMTRLYCMVFTGESPRYDQGGTSPRNDHGGTPPAPGRADARVKAHVHESPGSMTLPLVLLAAAAALAGFARPHIELRLAAASVVAAAAGILGAWALYAGGEKPAVRRFVSTFPRLYGAVRHKYRVDEIYAALFLRPLRALGFVLHEGLDRKIIDGPVVHGGPWLCDLLGRVPRALQNGDAQRYAALVVLGAAAIMWVALG